MEQCSSNQLHFGVQPKSYQSLELKFAHKVFEKATKTNCMAKSIPQETLNIVLKLPFLLRIIFEVLKNVDGKNAIAA